MEFDLLHQERLQIRGQKGGEHLHISAGWLFVKQNNYEILNSNVQYLTVLSNFARVLGVCFYISLY